MYRRRCKQLQVLACVAVKESPWPRGVAANPLLLIPEGCQQSTKYSGVYCAGREVEVPTWVYCTNLEKPSSRWYWT